MIADTTATGDQRNTQATKKAITTIITGASLRNASKVSGDSSNKVIKIGTKNTTNFLLQYISWLLIKTLLKFVNYARGLIGFFCNAQDHQTIDASLMQ
jgi:hypothetical protein